MFQSTTKHIFNLQLDILNNVISTSIQSIRTFPKIIKSQAEPWRKDRYKLIKPPLNPDETLGWTWTATHLFFSSLHANNFMEFSARLSSPAPFPQTLLFPLMVPLFLSLLTHIFLIQSLWLSGCFAEARWESKAVWVREKFMEYQKFCR